MNLPARFILSVALLLSVLTSVSAQSPSNQTPAATGSITGRVTINGQPAPGVIVALQAPASSQRQPLAEATTDAEGRYQLTGLAAGDYFVLPLAPGFAPPSLDNQQLFPRFTRLAAGVTVKDFDFVLVRGGVISGRVTNANGKPVIRESISLFWIDARGEKQRYFNRVSSFLMFTTDDRGAYRLYGLPAGRYLLGVGKTNENAFSTEINSPYYPLTFYPNATEEAQAKIVDLKAGSELTNIDITVVSLAQSYTVFGRIVDGETGQPIPNARFSFSLVKSESQPLRSFSGAFPVDAQGQFRQPGLLPGRYAFTLNAPETGYYSEAVTITLTDRDVSGLEIKARRAATISGVLTLEGNASPAVLALLSQLQLAITQQVPEMPFVRRQVPVSADGSFRIQGLLPGKVRLDLLPGPKAAFRLLRFERNGKPVPSLEVAPGEQITGTRLVVSYDFGVLRGKVEITGGALPAGVRLQVTATPSDPADQALYTRTVEVSAQGDFVIENLKSGGYSLMLRPVLAPGTTPSTLRVPITGQNTFVTGGAETKVTLSLNLPVKEGKQ